MHASLRDQPGCKWDCPGRADAQGWVQNPETTTKVGRGKSASKENFEITIREGKRQIGADIMENKRREKLKEEEVSHIKAED